MNLRHGLRFSYPDQNPRFQIPKSQLLHVHNEFSKACSMHFVFDCCWFHRQDSLCCLAKHLTRAPSSVSRMTETTEASLSVIYHKTLLQNFIFWEWIIQTDVWSPVYWSAHTSLWKNLKFPFIYIYLSQFPQVREEKPSTRHTLSPPCSIFSSLNSQELNGWKHFTDVSRMEPSILGGNHQWQRRRNCMHFPAKNVFWNTQ